VCHCLVLANTDLQASAHQAEVTGEVSRKHMPISRQYTYKHLEVGCAANLLLSHDLAHQQPQLYYAPGFPYSVPIELPIQHTKDRASAAARKDSYVRRGPAGCR